MMCFVMRFDFTRTVLCACVRMCVCVCVCVCVRVCVCACVRACHTEVKVSETTADVSRT